MADRNNRVGEQLGSYYLTSLLGEGGFAEVYLGEHLHLGTQVAIKVLHAQLTNEDVDSFRTEARTIAHLVHPNIVRVFDFGIQEKIPYLVMDYAPNGTLRKLHPKGTSLPVATIVTYVKQIADALQYAHDEKLIHRDIKPENMLVGRHNEVLLSDFGIALVAQSSRYQSIQEVIGTAAYMSPEQIQGKSRPASDQYSLGIVVYEWLCGDRPFYGSFTELCAQHMFASPPPLHEKVAGILPDIEHIVMTALAKDPKQRFASVRAFATAFEQASRSGQNLPSHPPANVTPSSQPLPSTILVTPPNQSVEPTIDALPLTPPNQFVEPTIDALPSTQSPPPIVMTPPPPPLYDMPGHQVQNPYQQYNNYNPVPPLQPFVMRPTITLRRNQTALIIGSIALVLVIVIIGIILIGPMNPSLHNSSSPQTTLHPPIADNKQVFVSSVVGANTSDITTFDPAQASDSYSTIAVQTVFTGLVSLDDKGNVRGQLATS